MKSCPKCLGRLENYRYACNAPGCAKVGIPACQGQEFDQQNKTAQTYACSECGQPMAMRICPDCGFELEADEMRRGFLSISIIGSEGSGKSNFLAVLIDQLRSEMCKVYGCTLYPTGGDRTMNHYERHYRRPLFEHGVCVTSTQQEDINPLTYTLLFSSKEKAAGQTVGLAFYDSCGKMLETGPEMAAHNKSLYSSGGIVFLIDPSQLPAIRESRKASNMPVLNSDAQALLLRAVHLIRNGLSIEGANTKINIPIAVCLTKLDTLYPHLDSASFIGDASRHLRRPMLNASDISSCNLEMMALLESWGGGELVRHVSSHFSDYCFFGISALGSAPGTQNEINRVSPHRALDPLLWLLSRHKILKTG